MYMDPVKPFAFMIISLFLGRCHLRLCFLFGG